jgi:drug/metabolite transporter (DMT)-like permease
MKTPLTRPLAYACLATAMILVGCYVALSKPLAMALPVFLLAWLRFGIAVVAMLPWLKKPADEPPMTGRTKRLLFLESFIGNFLFTLCMITGVSLTTAVSAGVIMSSIPATVAVMSWILLKERIGLRLWGSIACGAVGIGLLALAQTPLPARDAIAVLRAAPAQHAWLGDLLIFCAVLCESFYSVNGKKLSATLSPKRITALINLWGFCLMMPFGLYVALQFDFSRVSAGAWGLLVVYSLTASVVTVWLWMTGQKTVPAARAGLFCVLLPISVALTGVLVLGEHLNGVQVTAFAIALTGILLATVPERPTSADAVAPSLPLTSRFP